MSYVPQILTLAVVSALFATWLGLIVRRNRGVGPARPLHEKRWYFDIYRRGWRNISRCGWTLWLPLLGIIVAFAEAKVVNALIMKQHPEFQQMREQYEKERAMNLTSFLRTLPSTLPRNFLESANNMTDAVFSSLFRSYFLDALFLLAVMLILLRSRSPDGRNVENSDLRKMRLLGVVTGIAGIMLFLAFTYLRFFSPENLSLWAYFPFIALYDVVLAFASATFIHAIDFAARGENESFVTAVFGGAVCFWTLFLFFIVTAVIGFIISFAPSHVLWLFKGDVFMLETFQQVFTSIKLLFFIMLSLIPLLIVTQKLSFRSAFNECITFWAREWKNLSVFIAIGALILLIPVALEGRVQTVGNVVRVGTGGIAGWLVQVIKIVLGVFLLSSFVVFLKELQE